MKNKSIVPVSYLLEAIQLQKEDENQKVEIDNDKSLNAIKKILKNDDSMEGNCKQVCKSSQGKEYSYVYFVLRPR